ncbi:MAG: N-acetylmuramoyl-L-alanine amidase [Mangrovibacterium sp.]
MDLKVRIFVCGSYKAIVLTVFFFLACSVSNAQDYPRVKAQKGDGIYSLLKRHGLSPSEYLEQFVELNKAALGPNNSLFSGRSYKLPVAKPSSPSTTTSSTSSSPSNASASSSSGSVAYDIFGSKYKNVTRKDSQLTGAIYYLVSGHGGPDPGAIGHYGSNMLCEDEYAYDVVLRLGRTLLEHGAQVYTIVRDRNDGIRDESILKHDRDEYCYPDLTIPRSQLGRLRQRKDAVNNLYAKNRNQFQRLVEIHIDSRSKGQNIDVFFYHDKGSSTGKKLANNLHQTFREKYSYHQPGRGYQGTVSDRNLYMLKYSYPPAVFIELGNINHRRDQQRFMITDNRQAIANWLAEGLIRDFKNNR